MKKILLSAMAFAALTLNAQNVVEITMNDGTVQTYQTSSLENLKFTGGNNFTITDDEGVTTTFNGTAKHIKFKKNHYIDGTNATTIAKSIGLGWNLGNNMDAQNNGVASETAWGNPASTQATFDAVKAAGFTAVRVPITWLGHIGAAPDYKIEDSYMNRVAEIVGYCKMPD